ncbi:hypothetical protein [Paenibacillus ehimensis]|uniref:Uncharacterized protein n=1 Tax=Paenibacillus ehimensis TaxID=79264 RepID=A0ABT8V5J8_9BACL|nr:hypothetical protein [Paenibacillus ehimensis]MDO3676023.1 hypothetical protein [Paenibacillus ehimensis]MEC0213353.1 hypothetical protein [Paenibacillus ehimensis]
MNWHEEENKVKLHILHSLARSQRALARMIESVADVVEGSEETARKLSVQMEAISRYQGQIAMKMAGVRIRRLRRSRRGIPGKPWLGEEVKRTVSRERVRT